MTVSLRRASVADIPFIMATERRPGYDKVLGRFEEDEHTRLIADPAWAYMVISDGTDIAFAILNGLDNRDGNVCLKRFAVVSMSAGIGSAALPNVLRWTFEQTQAHRFWLRLVKGNEPAHRLYRKCGLSDEGIERQAGLAPDGSRFDFVAMSILRPEWAARAGQA